MLPARGVGESVPNGFFDGVHVSGFGTHDGDVRDGAVNPPNEIQEECDFIHAGVGLFRAALGPDVQVFSQGRLVADSLAHYLERRPDMIGGGTAGYLTTGNAGRVSSRATQFLRREITFEAA